MKIILTGFLCLFFSAIGLAQSENASDAGAAVTPEVEQISLLRDDGAGKAGADETENFSTADKILHFRIQLSSTKPATVKMILVAEDVAGLKAETKSITVSYTTNGRQNIVNFTASPEDQWLAGKYRADVYLDGKLAAKKEFEIQKAAPPVAAEKQTLPKEENKSAPKFVRRRKKNQSRDLSGKNRLSIIKDETEKQLSRQ